VRASEVKGLSIKDILLYKQRSLYKGTADESISVYKFIIKDEKIVLQELEKCALRDGE